MLNEKANAFNIDINRGFRLWQIQEIYQGQIDTDGINNHVPNVNDAVLDWEKGLFRVTYVNFETGISTLTPWTLPVATGPGSNDIALGQNRGITGESYSVYVNNDQSPIPLVFDARMHIYGSQTDHVKVFLGHDISNDSGDVVSIRYNSSQEIVGDTLGLSPLLPSETNQAIRTIDSGYAKYPIKNAEVLTVVGYTTAGDVSMITRVLAVQTGIVKGADVVSNEITGISLESAYIDLQDPDVIKVPLNLPLASLQLSAVLHYRDGKTRTLPISDSRVSLHGLTGYIPSVVGQRIPLVLSYQLQQDESGFGINIQNGAISKTYNALTTALDDTINVKLYVVPTYKGDIEGYQLRYFLYNANRQEVQEVTAQVQTDATRSQVYRPTFYNGVQTIAVSVDLSSVNPRFANVRHVQTFNISLLGPATTIDDPVRIDYNADGFTVYGEGVYATACLDEENPSQYLVDLSTGEPTLRTFLDKVYSLTDPIVLAESEAHAPDPTHMVISVGEYTRTISVNDFNKKFVLPYTPTLSTPLIIKWERRTVNAKLQLSLSSMNIINA